MRGQHEDRCSHALLPKAPAYIDPVTDREHDVQDDDVELRHLRPVQRLVSIGGNVDAIAVLGEPTGDEVRYLLLVFNQEDAHHSASQLVSSSVRSCSWSIDGGA